MAYSSLFSVWNKLFKTVHVEVSLLASEILSPISLAYPYCKTWKIFNGRPCHHTHQCDDLGWHLSLKDRSNKTTLQTVPPAGSVQETIMPIMAQRRPQHRPCQNWLKLAKAESSRHGSQGGKWRDECGRKGLLCTGRQSTEGPRHPLKWMQSTELALRQPLRNVGVRTYLKVPRTHAFNSYVGFQVDHRSASPEGLLSNLHWTVQPRTQGRHWLLRF